MEIELRWAPLNIAPNKSRGTALETKIVTGLALKEPYLSPFSTQHAPEEA